MGKHIDEIYNKANAENKLINSDYQKGMNMIVDFAVNNAVILIVEALKKDGVIK